MRSADFRQAMKAASKQAVEFRARHPDSSVDPCIIFVASLAGYLHHDEVCVKALNAVLYEKGEPPSMLPSKVEEDLTGGAA